MKLLPSLALAAVILMTACNPDEGIFEPDFDVYALLPAEGLGDRSFVDVLYEGLEQAKNTYNFRIRYVIPDSLQEGFDWISGIPRLRPEINDRILVIIGGNQYADALAALEGNFGTCNVLLLAVEVPEREGLACVTYRTFAPSYIGGYLSASRIPGCRAVTVSGFDAPFLRPFRAGFEQIWHTSVSEILWQTVQCFISFLSRMRLSPKRFTSSFSSLSR